MMKIKEGCAKLKDLLISIRSYIADIIEFI